MNKFIPTKYKKKKTKKHNQNYSTFRLLKIFVALFVLFVGIVYLVQTNNLAVQGYQIKDLENKLIQSKEERQLLEIQVTQLQSLQNIERKVNELGMVPIEDIHYISDNGSVAVAD